MIAPLHLLLLPAILGPMDQLTPQKLTFNQLAWHVPAESVRAPLQAQGFTFGGEIDSGDHAFLRQDSARLFAGLSDGRVVGFTLLDPARGEQVAVRYRVLADSLRTVLGSPDEEDAEEPYPRRLWEAGLSSVSVEVTRVLGERMVRVTWRGPGWYDEVVRRSGHAPPPPGFTTVWESVFLRIAVDTTINSAPTDGVRRGRFRIQYLQPITPSVGGVEQEPMDAVEYEMDYDCAGKRTRLISRTTFRDGRRLASNTPTRQPWTTPQQLDSHYARGLTVLCRAARR
jgi:hypothetical protein